jgi:hypothetical protein
MHPNMNAEDDALPLIPIRNSTVHKQQGVNALLGLWLRHGLRYVQRSFNKYRRVDCGRAKNDEEPDNISQQLRQTPSNLQ